LTSVGVCRLLEVRDIAYNESLKRFKAGRPGDLPCNKTVPLDFVMINMTARQPLTLQPIASYVTFRSTMTPCRCPRVVGRCELAMV
jgi:hypothetical protein